MTFGWYIENSQHVPLVNNMRLVKFWILIYWPWPLDMLHVNIHRCEGSDDVTGQDNTNEEIPHSHSKATICKNHGLFSN